MEDYKTKPLWQLRIMFAFILLFLLYLLYAIFIKIWIINHGVSEDILDGIAFIVGLFPIALFILTLKSDYEILDKFYHTIYEIFWSLELYELIALSIFFVIILINKNHEQK